MTSIKFPVISGEPTFGFLEGGGGGAGGVRRRSDSAVTVGGGPLRRNSICALSFRLQKHFTTYSLLVAGSRDQARDTSILISLYASSAPLAR